MAKASIILALLLHGVLAFGQAGVPSTIKDILPTASWHPGKEITTLSSDTDSLTFSKNDTVVSWNDLRFEKNGKIRQWTSCSKCKKYKGGYKTMVKDEWVDIGRWSAEDSSLTLKFGRTTVKLKATSYLQDRIKFVLTDFYVSGGRCTQ